MTEPEVLRSPRTSVRARTLLLLYAAALVVLTGSWRRGEWWGLLVIPAVSTYAAWRPPTLVSADGIRRPWTFLPRLSWDDVTAVVAAQPGDTLVHVVRANGRRVALPGIKAQLAGRVAHIGGKPLTDLTVARGVTPLPRLAMDDQMREREQRLARLQRNQAQLDQQYQQIQAIRPRSAADPGEPGGPDAGR